MHTKLYQTQSSLTSVRRRCLISAFTLIELLVVISIVSLLIAILLPALAGARQTAQAIRCSANIRSIGMALHMYASDSDDYWVSARDPNVWQGMWTTVLTSTGYIKRSEHKEQLFKADLACPTNSKTDPMYSVSYFAMLRTNDSSPDKKYDTLWGVSGKDPQRWMRLSYAYKPSDVQALAEGVYALKDYDNRFKMDYEPYLMDTGSSVRRTSNPLVDLTVKGRTVCFDDGHLGNSNLLFADNHVSRVAPDKLEWRGFRIYGVY